MESQAPAGQLTAAEPTDRARRQVRNFLLDTGLQLRLASYLVAVATALSLALGWLLWRAYRETSQVLELSDPQVGTALGAALARVDRFRILMVAGALVGVLACLLAAAVIVTHRIAGPAYALRQACRRVAEGDLTEPRPLRSGDLLLDLGDELVVMVRALRGREAGERERLAQAAAVLRDPAATAAQREAAAGALEALAAEKERRLAP